MLSGREGPRGTRPRRRRSLATRCALSLTLAGLSFTCKAEKNESAPTPTLVEAPRRDVPSARSTDAVPGPVQRFETDEDVATIDIEGMRDLPGNARFVEMFDQGIQERDFPCIDAKVERHRERRAPRRINVASRFHGNGVRDKLTLSLFGAFVTVLAANQKRPHELDIIWRLDSDHGAGNPRSGPGSLYLSPITYDFIAVKLDEHDKPRTAVVCPGQFDVDFSEISATGDVHRFTMKARYGVRATVEAELSALHPKAVTLRPILQRLDGHVVTRDDGNDLVVPHHRGEYRVWSRTRVGGGVHYVPFSKARKLDVVWDHGDRSDILYGEILDMFIVTRLGIAPIEIGPDGFAPPPRYRDLPPEHHVAHRLTLMRFDGGAPEPVAFANDGTAILRLGGLDGPATLYKAASPMDLGEHKRPLDPVVADLDGDGTDELYLLWNLFDPPVVDAVALALARGQPPPTLGDFERNAIVQVSIQGGEVVVHEMKVNWSKTAPTYVIRYDDDVVYKPTFGLDEVSEVG